jgi:hypothetical protein
MVQRMGRIVRRKTDGRRARFVVAFIRDTIEDPAFGAHESFLDEVTAIATTVVTLTPSTPDSWAELVASLSPWPVEPWPAPVASLAPWPAPNPAGPGVLKPSASAAAAVHGHVVGITPHRGTRVEVVTPMAAQNQSCSLKSRNHCGHCGQPRLPQVSQCVISAVGRRWAGLKSSPV